MHAGNTRGRRILVRKLDHSRITEIHHHLHASLQQLLHILDSIRLPVIVTSTRERIPHRRRGLREILVCANRSLNLRTIQIIDIVLVRERIRHQLARIILIATRVNIEHILDLVGAEIIRYSADIVAPGCVALLRLVDAVPFAVEVIVPLCLDRGVVWIVVVGVTGEDGEVVVSLVLD